MRFYIGPWSIIVITQVFVVTCSNRNEQPAGGVANEQNVSPATQTPTGDSATRSVTTVATTHSLVVGSSTSPSAQGAAQDQVASGQVSSSPTTQAITATSNETQGMLCCNGSSSVADLDDTHGHMDEPGVEDTTDGEMHVIHSYISTRKLVIVVTTVGSGLVLLVVVLTVVVCCCRRSIDDDAKIQEVGGVRRDRKFSTTSTYTMDEEENKESYMGIPTNHQIWKELQMLPSESPSVMTEQYQKTPL